MTNLEETQAAANMVAEGSPTTASEGIAEAPAAEASTGGEVAVANAGADAEPDPQAGLGAGLSDLVHRDPPPAVERLATVGRIVQYRLTADDAHAINRRRGGITSGEHWPHGAVAHFGNYASAGDVLPMLVVKKWGGDMVNGQVFLDGNDTFWVTSVHEAALEGHHGAWSWPPRV